MCLGFRTSTSSVFQYRGLVRDIKVFWGFRVQDFRGLSGRGEGIWREEGRGGVGRGECTTRHYVDSEPWSALDLNPRSLDHQLVRKPTCGKEKMANY